MRDYFQRSALVANSQLATIVATMSTDFQRSALVANSQQGLIDADAANDFQRSALVANSQRYVTAIPSIGTFKDLL